MDNSKELLRLLRSRVEAFADLYNEYDLVEIVWNKEKFVA
jgi:hypothetical protein